MTSQECQLIAEIEFWREMIECRKTSANGAGQSGTGQAMQESPALERMRHALALAERKLLMLAPAGVETRPEWPLITPPIKGPERKH
jgi:hypothetical protein